MHLKLPVIFPGKPVITSGKVDGREVYQVDYCCLSAKQISDGLIIAEDGSVAQAFPQTVWLTEQAESISEFYLLYLVKSGRKAIITGVRTPDQPRAAGFKTKTGFLVK